MTTKGAIHILTPEEMAAAQNFGTDNRAELCDVMIRVLTELIQLRIRQAGYIPYIDHPRSHPSNYFTEIPIDSVCRGYLQYLRVIFEPRGWQLLPQSRYDSGECAVVVLQTIEERRDWIKKMWEKGGHRLAPWELGHCIDTTHCLNEGCNLKIIFRRQIPTEYRDGTEYPIGEKVWAGDFIKCPATPSSED